MKQNSNVFSFLSLIVIALFSAHITLSSVVTGPVFATNTEQCGDKTTYEKTGDFSDSRVDINFESSDKQIDVSAKQGYKINKVWLDVDDDGQGGYFQYATGPLNNFNPNPGDDINKAKVEVEKVCATPTQTPTPVQETEKWTICHATSSSSNPYTRIVVSSKSQGGHFDNSGTPNSGHEDDILFPGDVDCPEGETPTATPTPTVYVPQPTATPTPTTYIKEEPTPTPTTVYEEPTPTRGEEYIPTPTPTTTQEYEPTPTPEVEEECDGICRNIELTPTPTVTPTAGPTATSTPAPTATPTPGSSSGGSSNTGGSSSGSSSSSSSSNGGGQVLGVSSLANTGVFLDNVANMIVALGMLIVGTSSSVYVKKKKRA